MCIGISRGNLRTCGGAQKAKEKETCLTGDSFRFPWSTLALFCFPEIINFSKRDLPGWDSFTCRWHYSLGASIALSLSTKPSSASLLSLSYCVVPAYIKRTVSLAALGDMALIFQRCRTGVMQCAAIDTLHEDLSLLKWAKLGRASLSDTGIYLWRLFLFSVLY